MLVHLYYILSNYFSYWYCIVVSLLFISQDGDKIKESGNDWRSVLSRLNSTVRCQSYLIRDFEEDKIFSSFADASAFYQSELVPTKLDSTVRKFLLNFQYDAQLRIGWHMQISVCDKDTLTL